MKNDSQTFFYTKNEMGNLFKRFRCLSTANGEFQCEKFQPNKKLG